MMTSILDYRREPDVQKLLNDPRVLGSNSLRSLFDNLRRAEKDLGLKDLAKTLMSKGDAGYQIHVSIIDEEPGYNPRDYNAPDIQESIGVLTDRYANDKFVEDITTIVRDGKVLVREGHTRRLSFRNAIENHGAQIIRIGARPYTGDRAEEDLIPITSNSSNRLKPIEVAVLLQRQIDRHGKSMAEIAKAIGKTETHVRQTIKLLEMPENMQELVRRGQIAPDLALELVSEYGINAAEKAMSALDEASSAAGATDEAGSDQAATGKAPAPRITRKKLQKGTPAAIKLTKSSKENLWNTFDSLASKLGQSTAAGEKVTVELDQEEVKRLLELHETFQKQINGDSC